MPFLLFIIGVITAAGVWYWRMKQAGEVVGELANAAQDVKNAARRFGFNRKKNVHPADSLDDARIAAVGVVLTVAASDGELTAGELDATKLEAAKTFNIDATEAGEMVALARWTVSQCGNTDNAIYRLARRTRALAGLEAQPDLERMARAVAAVDTGAMAFQDVRGVVRDSDHYPPATPATFT